MGKLDELKNNYFEVLSNNNYIEEEIPIIESIINLKVNLHESERLELEEYIDDILKDLDEPKNNMNRIITKNEKLNLKKKEIEGKKEAVKILKKERNMLKDELKSIIKETAIEWDKNSHNDRNWELINKNNTKELTIRKRMLDINLEIVNRNGENLEKLITFDRERIKKLEKIMENKK